MFAHRRVCVPSLRPKPCGIYSESCDQRAAINGQAGRADPRFRSSSMTLAKKVRGAERKKNSSEPFCCVLHRHSDVSRRSPSFCLSRPLSTATILTPSCPSSLSLYLRQTVREASPAGPTLHHVAEVLAQDGAHGKLRHPHDLPRCARQLLPAGSEDGGLSCTAVSTVSVIRAAARLRPPACGGRWDARVDMVVNWFDPVS